MHELSVALSIVDIVHEEVKKARASKVKEIELQIGQMAGIETEALDFAWEQVIKGTELENATKKIEYVKALAYCPDCGWEFELVNRFDPCPGCNSFFYHLKSGKELKIKSLVIE